MPFCGACTQFVEPQVSALPAASVSGFAPARQPTTAITAPAGPLALVAGRTTTSVTTLAKKQSGVVVSPAQSGEYPAGVLGRSRSTKLAPPSVERKRPLLVAA